MCLGEDVFGDQELTTYQDYESEKFNSAPFPESQPGIEQSIVSAYGSAQSLMRY